MKRILSVEIATPLLLILLGVVFFNLRITGFDLRYLPGDTGDARFINYLLEHGYAFVQGEHDSFWTAPFMFPIQNTIALSDHLILCIPFYSLYRMMGAEMETALQFWWIISSVFNFASAYYISRKLFKNPFVCGTIAFVFAFGTINLWQINYLQMNARYFVPFVLYYSYQLVNSPSKRSLILYITFLLLQFYTVMYTAFFLFYFSFGFMILYALISKNFNPLMKFYFVQNRLKTSLTIILGVLLMLLLLIPYVRISETVGLKLFAEVKWNLPDLKAFLFAHPSSIYGALGNFFQPETELWWLQSTFTGLMSTLVLLATPILLVLHYLKKYRLSFFQLSLAWTIFIIFLLFLRTESGNTLYALIFKLPGMNSMRVLNRFTLVWVFFILLFLGTMLKNTKLGTSFLTLVLAIADQFFMPSLVTRQDKNSLIERRLSIEKILAETNKQANYEAFAVVSEKDAHFNVHLDAMMASFSVNLPCINGYSSSCPDAFGQFFDQPNAKNCHAWMRTNNFNEDDIIVINSLK